MTLHQCSAAALTLNSSINDVYFVLSTTVRISLCVVHVVCLSLWWWFADTAFCVLWLSMHSCFWFRWEVDFSGFWLLYFSINAVLKTYLLDLYSYRKYFILISLKEKVIIRFIMYCFDCAVPDLAFSLYDMSQPVLFNLTWRENLPFIIFFFFSFLSVLWSETRSDANKASKTQL